MPVPVLKVADETPLSLQGDTAERPSPAPNAIKTRANAAAATAPAAIAAQDTPDCASTVVDAGYKLDSIWDAPGFPNNNAVLVRIVPRAQEMPAVDMIAADPTGSYLAVLLTVGPSTPSVVARSI